MTCHSQISWECLDLCHLNHHWTLWHYCLISHFIKICLFLFYSTASETAIIWLKAEQTQEHSDYHQCWIWKVILVVTFCWGSCGKIIFSVVFTHKGFPHDYTWICCKVCSFPIKHRENLWGFLAIYRQTTNKTCSWTRQQLWSVHT